jgi:hypothetical protein
MKKENQVESSKLKELVRQRFGEKDRDRLEEHFSYMEWEEKESRRHKEYYFGRGKLMRWTGLGCGVASGILAFGIFEENVGGLLLFLKISLTMCSILGPLLIAFLKDSQDLEKNRETWIRHRTYVNNCINECLEYSNGVKQYDGMNEEEARKLFLKNLVTHRENNNQKFGENMNQ